MSTEQSVGRNAPVAVTIALAVLGLLLIALAVVYFVDSADALPSFLPGHQAGVTKHHTKHGLGALVLATAVFQLAAWHRDEPDLVLHIDASPAELQRAIRTAHGGGTVLAPSVASLLMAQVRKPASAAGPLSERELEVLALIAKGRSNRDAAAELFISEATVKTHLMHVYAKLQVNDRAAAVAAAYERGLLQPRGR